jgi:predicted metalloprotease
MVKVFQKKRRAAFNLYARVLVRVEQTTSRLAGSSLALARPRSRPGREPIRVRRMHESVLRSDGTPAPRAQLIRQPN